MRSVFVVQVTVDTDDLDAGDLCEDIEMAASRGVEGHCPWVPEVIDCRVVDVYPAGREVRNVSLQGRLL